MASAENKPVIYTSPYPKINIPKINVFESIFPTKRIDLFPGHRPALIDGLTGETWTRAQLKQFSLTLAWHLRNTLGLKEGDVLMIASPNSIQYGVVLLGALAAGLKLTFANPAYTVQELDHQLTDSGTAAIFAHPDAIPNILASAFVKANPKTFKSRLVLMPHAATISAAITAKKYLLLDDLLANQKEFTPVEMEGEKAVQTTAFLYYSSGTTGKGKGVETTHHNMVSGFEMATTAWHSVHASQDVMLCAIPLYHITGGCVAMMYPLNRATPIVVLPRFDPQHFLNAIQTYRVTVIVVAPPILLFFQNAPIVDQYDVSSLKTISSGSAPCSKELIENVRARLWKLGSKVAVGQVYGLTETSPGTNIVPPEWTLYKPHCVGRLHPNMEARIVDDDERDVPPGPTARGELWFRGPNIMKGYLNNPEATKNALTPDGWFKTGDIAMVDEDGFWQVVDRKKELIKYKGFQVAPAELEALLIQNPDIADAGVVGVWDPNEQTELPRAYVVPRNPALLPPANSTPSTPPTAAQAAFSKQIQDWAKSRAVHYKQLRGGVILLPALPRSQAGKILRKDLRVLAEQQPVPQKAKL
ncbi:AMP binding protein [Clavulina sp. PMI_390]|nr:AMP binding protein [Clavulina sp. PMI_390]